MVDTFLSRFIASCESRPEKTAMRIVGDESQAYTFGEMLRAVRSVAFRLRAEKVEFGDRVALIGENHPCWAVAYLAALYHGAVCVPLDPHGEIGTLRNFLENSEAKLAFIGPDVAEKFAEIQQGVAGKIPVVVWGLAPARESEPRALATGASE